MAMPAVSRIVASLLAAACLGSAGAPETTPPPRPDASVQAGRLIDEGVALHDLKDYDGALAKYRQALELDPENTRALFETAYSLYEKKDLAAAAAYAERSGLAPDPPRQLPVMLGNIYDDLGDSKKAIATYRRGIAKDPNLFLLYFNLGTTYERLGNRNIARAAFENSASLEPRHASSHLYLARVYKAQGYRVPAILALTRFLLLEGSGPRAEGAVLWLDEMFEQGVELKADGSTNITVDPDRPKDEGDFTGPDMMVSLVQASKNLPRTRTIRRRGPSR